MEIIEAKNYDEMSQKAAQLILTKVKQTPSLVLGLATGRTPVGTYLHLVKDYQEHQTSYRHVHTVNLDEYVGLGKENPTSYHTYMKEHLFNHIDIPNHQTHLPNGMATDLQGECQIYDELIENLGGIDLQILGIGVNGHIGFNEPGTSFSSTTNVVELTPSTRGKNACYFNNLSEVPSDAVTMGISTIMKSKQIVLLVSGMQKAHILYKLLSEPINEQIPASILKQHDNVIIIADNEALAVIRHNGSAAKTPR
ncbi:glucosamine-6-phosphate deaminase [Peribacillus muralis]|uniref:glucosamine-6-phosphate deaminase n=1 Tax=Peribacillus muralis TaxID=264697 RepID=UPI00070A38DF|nr:glucosamine-6-phosphate deaminase [Peribacillus muralis]